MPLSEKDQKLLKEAKTNNRSAVKKLLHEGANVNAQSEKTESGDSGHTAFMYACMKGYKGLVKDLLDLHCDLKNKISLDINLQTAKGYTALMLAIKNNHPNVLQLILDHKSQLFKKIAYDCVTTKNRKNILILAAIVSDEKSAPCLELLVNNSKALKRIQRARIMGIQMVNAKDVKGKTALMYAAERNNYAAVECLLKIPDVSRENISSAFICALQNGCAQAAGMLKAHCAEIADPKDLLEATDLHKFLTREMMESLFPETKNPIVFVQNCTEENADLAALLLTVMKNYKPRIDFSNLHSKDFQNVPNRIKYMINRMAKTGVSLLAQAKLENPNIEVFEDAVKNGADLNFNKNQVPIISAASHGHTQLVKYLIEHGADINIPNQIGLNALLLAANKGHADVVELLLKNGANPNISDPKDGYTPLMQAVINPETSDEQKENVIRVLLKYGANPFMTQSIAKHESDDQWGNNVYGLVIDMYDEGNSGLRALLKCKVPFDVHYNDTPDPVVRACNLYPRTKSAVEIFLKMAPEAFLSKRRDPRSGLTRMCALLKKDDEKLLTILIKKGDKYKNRLKKELKNYTKNPIEVCPNATKLLLTTETSVLSTESTKTLLKEMKKTEPNPEVIMKAINEGADLNPTYTDPPITVAANMLNVDLIRLFIERGANVNAKNKEGNTALFNAIDIANSRSGSKKEKLLPIVKLLLDNSADPTIGQPLAITMGYRGYLSLDMICTIVELLLKHGAKPNVMSSYGLQLPLNNAVMVTSHEGSQKEYAERLITLLISHGADPSLTDGRGDDAITTAVYMRNSEALRVLLAHGAKINPQLINKILDNAQVQLLRYYKNNKKQADKILKLLIEAEPQILTIPINTRDQWTILNSIVDNDAADLVKFILDKGYHDLEYLTPEFLERNRRLTQIKGLLESRRKKQ